MITLSSLKPAPGSKHRKKRVGCGESSGHGKTSGRGHKGQKARSGGSIRLGFEGGQMPLIRRMPKRGFSNEAFAYKWGVVNLRDLVDFDAGTVIDEAFLREQGLVRGSNLDGVKVLGTGEISKALKFKINLVSASAREKIEKAGGSIELIVKAPAAE